MNTEQLKRYIKAQTGRSLHSAALSRYIRNDWLLVDKSQGGAANHYTLAAADTLVKHLLSLDLKVTAKLMSGDLGWHISYMILRTMCQDGLIACIQTPSGHYRIPQSSLPDIKQKLIADKQERDDLFALVDQDAARVLLRHCLGNYDLTELAATCGISLSMMSRINSGTRRMTSTVYEKLLAIKVTENGQ